MTRIARPGRARRGWPPDRRGRPPGEGGEPRRAGRRPGRARPRPGRRAGEERDGLTDAVRRLGEPERPVEHRGWEVSAPPRAGSRRRRPRGCRARSPARPPTRRGPRLDGSPRTGPAGAATRSVEVSTARILRHRHRPAMDALLGSRTCATTTSTRFPKAFPSRSTTAAATTCRAGPCHPSRSRRRTDRPFGCDEPVPGWTIVFAYPRTGEPEADPPGGLAAWDAIPGARGCTPQACAYRDHHAELVAAGARVFGLSTQDTAYQREMAERLHLPFPVLSDEDLALTRALELPDVRARRPDPAQAADARHPGGHDRACLLPGLPVRSRRGAGPGLASRLTGGALGSELAP